MINTEIRSRGVGGSEVAAILGMDPRRDAFSVYADKLGLVRRAPASGRMEAGKFLEQGIARWYAHRTHQEVVWCDETMCHSEREWQVYTPDAFVGIDGPYEPWAGGLDSKNVAFDQADKWGEPGTDAVPDSIHIQCQWYCSAAELPWWDVAACFGGNDLRIYRINRDSQIEAAILEECDLFWRRHVLTRVPPPAGPSPATVEALKQMFPRNVSNIRFATAEEANLMAELKAANEAWEPVNQRCVAAENRVKLAIGEAEGLMNVDGSQVTWRREKDSHGPDWQAIARELGMRLALLDGNGVVPPEWRQSVDQLAAQMTHVTRQGARKLHPKWGKKK
jgi:predicted phage-related endonuclease